MRVVDRALQRAVDSAYGCGAGVLRAVGLNALSRRILNARTVALVRAHLDLMEATLETNKHKLKELKDEMYAEQLEMEAAVQAVRRMSQRRVEERRLRAERAGVPFVHKKGEELKWMNDYEEIRRIDDLRAHKMRYRQLEKRVNKMHAAMLTIQQQQAAFEDVLGNSDLISDLELITEQLNESNSLLLDPLVAELVTKAYRIFDDVSEAQDRAAELADEVRAVQDALPDRRPMSADEERDIIDLIFESTEAPRAAVAAAPGRAQRAAELVAA